MHHSGKTITFWSAVSLGIGSITILFIHSVVQFGHLRIIKETGASLFLVATALAATATAAVAAAIYESRVSPHIVLTILLFLLLSFMSEVIFQYFVGRKIKRRL